MDTEVALFLHQTCSTVDCDVSSTKTCFFGGESRVGPRGGRPGEGHLLLHSGTRQHPHLPSTDGLMKAVVENLV